MRNANAGIRYRDRFGTVHEADLASVYEMAEECNDGCVTYQETTAAKLLEYLCLDEDEEAPAYIRELAEKFGWDTVVYRADYLTGNNIDTADAYTDKPIDRTEAILAFLTHDGGEILEGVE